MSKVIAVVGMFIGFILVFAFMCEVIEIASSRKRKITYQGFALGFSMALTIIFTAYSIVLL